jgi:MerR family transcriptional regulator/heat shock protein HspR
MNLDNRQNEPIFPISTAARLLNISVQTLRLYEKEGLVLPFKKSSKHRLYSKADIERIDCIRNAISEKKISIQGIITMYSLIPCWDVVKCSSADREICRAFSGHSQPCWSFLHPHTTCENRICRDCSVYKDIVDCEEIKDSIKKISDIK